MQRAGAETIHKGKPSWMINLDSATISNPKNNAFPKEFLLLLITAVLTVFYIMIIALPVGSIFRRAGLTGILAAAGSGETLSVLGFSLATSGIALFFTFFLGTPVVYLLTSGRGTMTRLCGIVVNLPTMLPPAVAGIGLLMAFGRQGMVGAILERMSVQIVFTPLAVILAQFFVSSAFYVQILRTGVNSVEREIYEASYVFGAGRLETFMRIILPMMKRNIAAGLMVAWTRAVGEFGATIMFAGNIQGRTRTVPLQIYTLMQTDYRAAASVSAILFLFSFLLLWISGAWLKNK